MDTIFYHNDLNNPVELNIKPVKIESSGNNKIIGSYTLKGEQKKYLNRYLTTERNSRLNAILPNTDIWEIKWKASLNSSSIPWCLLYKNEHIIVQNESGWQLFDSSGKNIANGMKADGEVFIDEAEDIFYINDQSGFLQAIDLNTGEIKFYVFPYLGKGFERSVIFSNREKIINSAIELPVMTHNSPIKTPAFNILETIVIGKSRETDEDGVLESAAQKQNLVSNTGKLLTAVHDSTIVSAVPNHIFIIDSDLNIIKEFDGDFVPLEMSIDEEMRIYLLSEVQSDEKNKSVLMIIDSTGNLINETEIDPVQKNYFAPPVIDFDHNVFIRYEEKILALDQTGNILWEQYIQKPLAGISALKDYLFVAEGNMLTAFDLKGERKFFYNFDEQLTTAPILVDERIFITTTKNLYCLAPKR